MMASSSHLQQRCAFISVCDVVVMLFFFLCPQPYFPGRCDRLLKWKPSDLNSVDFRLSIVERNQTGCVGSLGHI